jgi:hypothetical protein
LIETSSCSVGEFVNGPVGFVFETSTNLFGWVTSDNGITLNIFGDYGSCCNHAPFSYSNAAKDNGAITDPDIVADYDLDVLAIPFVIGIAYLMGQASRCANVAKVMVISANECDPVSHDHIVANVGVTFDLAMASDIAAMADSNLIGSPEDNAPTGVKAGTDVILAPLDMGEV